MKQLTIFILGFTIFWGCKENNSQNGKTPITETELKTDSVFRQPIEVFSIVHDSTFNGDTEQLTELLNGLDKSYEENKDLIEETYFEGYLDSYKRKGFLKMLARDFENDSFVNVTQTSVSFLTCEEGDRLVNLRIIEWNFDKESTAKSCFDSLTTYSNRDIYFKVISWIWIQQKNKLFLVFTTDSMVDSEPMQNAKRHLIDNLKERGEYRTVEFY